MPLCLRERSESSLLCVHDGTRITELYRGCSIYASDSGDHFGDELPGAASGFPDVLANGAHMQRVCGGWGIFHDAGRGVDCRGAAGQAGAGAEEEAVNRMLSKFSPLPCLALAVLASLFCAAARGDVLWDGDASKGIKVFGSLNAVNGTVTVE